MKKNRSVGWAFLSVILIIMAAVLTVPAVFVPFTGMDSFGDDGIKSYLSVLVYDVFLWWAAIGSYKKTYKLDEEERQQANEPIPQKKKKKKWKWPDAVSIDVVDYGIRYRHNLARHGLSALFGGIFLGTYGIARANHKHGGVDIPYVVFELTYPDGSTEVVNEDADSFIYTHMVRLMEELEAKQEAAEAEELEIPEEIEVTQEPITVEESTAQNRLWGMPDAVSITFVGHQQTQKKVRFFLTYPDGTTEEVIADNHGGLYRYLMNRKAELEKLQ